ncbi:hypothetical protein DSO57_1036237 [Entomophthora muscae]|uniref:Uncharacterized protein n=1 Tax=Entomophthora muscae TaxID=34485 RepID=A0ACC2U8Z9_9FUNG|nr:hypothetical protein DSO57_1036237 [Entomophthora muscae]
MMATAASPVGVVDEDGCCPGLSRAPQIQCARELIALANKVDQLKWDHTELDRDIQEINEVIESVNDRFASCLSVRPSLTSRLAELSTIVTTQGQHLDTTAQQTTQAASTGAHAVETLTTLEESVHQLWARQPPSESEAEFSPCINVLDSNFKVLWPTFGPGLGCISQAIKKVVCVQAKPLQNLEDLAHMVDKRFVLAFLAEVPISPLESPPTMEETLIQLDCLLFWCCLVLKQLANQQKMQAT